MNSKSVPSAGSATLTMVIDPRCSLVTVQRVTPPGWAVNADAVPGAPATTRSKSVTTPSMSVAAHVMSVRSHPVGTADSVSVRSSRGTMVVDTNVSLVGTVTVPSDGGRAGHLVDGAAAHRADGEPEVRRRLGHRVGDLGDLQPAAVGDGQRVHAGVVLQFGVGVLLAGAGERERRLRGPARAGGEQPDSGEVEGELAERRARRVVDRGLEAGGDGGGSPRGAAPPPDGAARAAALGRVVLEGDEQVVGLAGSGADEREEDGDLTVHIGGPAPRPVEHRARRAARVDVFDGPPHLAQVALGHHVARGGVGVRRGRARRACRRVDRGRCWRRGSRTGRVRRTAHRAARGRARPSRRGRRCCRRC